MSGEVWAKGPDKEGLVEVHIPPWIFRFAQDPKGNLKLLSSWRTDKDRAYKEDDITPPSWLVNRAISLARIRFSTFGAKKRSFDIEGDDGEQLPLPL